jgi:putative hydrolase of the HAD superfamily
MSRATLSHVNTWVFDLDNTLYPPDSKLFEQISKRMNAWVAAYMQMSPEAADLLRRSYRSRFGTTLAGLMQEHGVDPVVFLSNIHAIDLSVLAPDPALAAAIRGLPGRKIIHTNADATYAGRVLAARGLTGLFDAIYGIEATGFRPKPLREAYAAVIAADGFDPARAVMFDDEARNLAVPHALGMATVQVAPVRDSAPHVLHWTKELGAFLSAE